MALIVTPGHLKRNAEFYRELAALLSAGVPILQALETIHRRPPAHSFRAPLARVISQVSAGSTFSDALADPHRWMAPFDLALIRAGEQSGRLVECCRSLAEHYTERAGLADRTIAQMLYPVFLFHLAVLVFPPSLLPRLILQGQVGAFIFHKLSVLLPVYGVVLAAAYAFQSRRGLAWRAALEAILAPVPILGTARHEQALARLAISLEALISAGVTIVEAWELAAPASGSPAMVRVTTRWKPRLAAGEVPSELIRESSQFPELFANLYHTGEISGQLDQELRHLAQYYRDSSGRKLGQFMLAMTLLVSLGVMIGIGFWIIQFWVGYYNNLFKAVGLE
jgi:type II secretory pathway component PulF